ncbi:hypothetical protein [Muricauda sp. MAR_2010_75]|uniref:hypothetical protein n=1 Tax=Allomuricauda sp. MAR_2010_75 TaxID=1250232 RepID=UPI00056700AE|nr:hypothetical protein [Muricauda sp. MAR_2010_75]
MKNNYIVTMALLCMAQSLLFGQSNAQLLQTLPQESTYVHYNQSTVLSGEELLYKFYGLDNTTKQLTEISKIGYVSLIDSIGKVVFSHKIRLESGSGSGDFFIPVSLPTGTYKLLGYTQWMQNFGQKNFFKADIFIINPYETIPEAYLEKSADSLQENTPSKLKSFAATGQVKNSPFIDMVLDKSRAAKRDKVTISLKGINESKITGSYSISVRKKDSVSFGKPLSSEIFLRDLNRRIGQETHSEDFHLPEIRGEVISGTIVKKDTRLPVENQRIGLSLPGEAFLFKVATSNEEGKFSFILDRKYNNTAAALQVMAEDADQYEVNLDAGANEYNDLVFPEFVIPQILEKSILQRSVHNQIENAYSEIRLDSVIHVEQIAPFYRDLPIVYDLDAYTRFNTLTETIIEVTDHLSIKTLNDGNRIFEVRPNVGLSNDNLTAAVFVDGLFIKKHEDFIGYSAKKVKSISFSRDNVMIGSQAFQGILSFKTIEGNFYNEYYSPDIKSAELFKPELQKKYFKQEYTEGDEQAHIPDFRYQLLWQPNVDLSKKTQEIVFYTSDVAGTYELVLEGFTSNGNPVSVKRGLIVE